MSKKFLNKGDIKDIRSHPDYGWGKTRRKTRPDDFLLLPHPNWEDPEVQNPPRSGDFSYEDDDEDYVPDEVSDYLTSLGDESGTAGGKQYRLDSQGPSGRTAAPTEAPPSKPFPFAMQPDNGPVPTRKLPKSGPPTGGPPSAS